MKPETVTFADGKAVAIADADGVPIFEGSVLREINDGDRGVVVRILRAGYKGTCLDAVGDMQIRIRHGTTRVTNRYNQWKHIPHAEQTYDERYQSWLVSPSHYDPEYCQTSKDEYIATRGIMALLPRDTVNLTWDVEPDRIEDALRYLVRHLTTNQPQPPKKP